MSAHSDNANSEVWPKWMRDVRQLLPIKQQFLLSGSTRDSVTFSSNSETPILPLHRAITHVLKGLGFDAVLRWDLIDRLEVFHCKPENRGALLRLVSPQNPQESCLSAVGLSQLGDLIRRLAKPPEDNPIRVALIVDFCSRIPDQDQYVEEVKLLYVKAEKAAQVAEPLAHSINGVDQYLYNPVFWLTNRPNEVPFWFPLDNSRVHALSIPEPGADDRAQVLRQLLVKEYSGLSIGERDQVVKDVVNLTHGMSIDALGDIVKIAAANRLPAERFDEAVECFRVGDLGFDNPWRSLKIRDSIAQSMESFQKRVMGQDHALRHVVNVLKRTWLGLTGAQAKSSSSRPRGVLFFVGPTGVGKTELAKAITEVVFGDESNYTRFDMSEFSAEHSEARLIGAPPGYVGFDRGGELTNALKENPFQVFLFDEIEKANNRILDKFLQVLEDGRLTDGRGETVYFTDSLLIFTSNKGASIRNEDGSLEVLVKPGMDRAKYEEAFMKGVEHYFFKVLDRPELFNRIGENFIIFDFIESDVARMIMDKMLRNIVERIADEQNLQLELSDVALQQLAGFCTEDLRNGGRGIGSKLEDILVNPLAGHIFDTAPPSGSHVIVNKIVTSGSEYRLECENRAQ